MAINIGIEKGKIYIGNTKVSKVYLGSRKIYSSGSTCTYICDGNTYQEEVDEGASCLSPKTFTPAKSGWEFAGWRQDTAANGSVLNSLVMGDVPITLYAVFRQTITLSYNGNSATSGSTAAQTGIRYYNNGNVANPSFTLRTCGSTRTGYTFSKWALGSASGTQYAAGANVTLSTNTVMYAVWIGTPHYFTPLNGVTWSKSHITSDLCTIKFFDDSPYLYLSSVKTGYGVGQINVSATIPTGGCTKVKFKGWVNRYNFSAIICDGVRKEKNTAEAEDFEFDFNISSKASISVTLSIATGSDDLGGDMVLHSIYFYN